jgi:phage-related protein
MTAVEPEQHEEGEFRLLYVAKFAEAIYVMHAFSKKTQQTRQADIEMARSKLAEVLGHRRQG